MELNIIAAMSQNRVIGKNNQIPWRLSTDFKRVKQLTTGHSIIMGRKTYESIGKPLPNRTNIVLSRDPNYSAPGCLLVHSLEKALENCDQGEPFIFGGHALYQASLPIATRLYLTLVDLDVDGDTYFPEWDPTDWSTENQSQHEENGIHFQFLELVRRPMSK